MTNVQKIQRINGMTTRHSRGEVEDTPNCKWHAVRRIAHILGCLLSVRIIRLPLTKATEWTEQSGRNCYMDVLVLHSMLGPWVEPI